MIAQYTQAAIVSELKRLAVPASVDSIPSSAMQEDHVSMGWSAARKLRRAVDGLTRVLAIELLTAARGIELRAPLAPAAATAAVIAALREHVARRRPRPLPRPRDRGRRGARAHGRGAPRRRVRLRTPRLNERNAMTGQLHTVRAAARHRAVLPRLAAGGRATGCSTTTSTPRSRSAPRTSSSTAAPARPRATGRPSTRSRARCARSRTTRRCSSSPASPSACSQTHEWAPRVLLANSNLVGDWANWEEFRRLEALGLTMYGQMTAGSWIYIGSQGILQGTYETFAAVGAKRFGGSLAGTITLTAGLGGMGGAQPLAVTMAGGVAICIEVDPSRIARRIAHGYLDAEAADIDDALRARHRGARRAAPALDRPARQLPPSSCRELLAMGAPIDIVTDQTSAHDPLAYLPAGVAFEDWRELAASDPAAFTERARESMARHVEAMVGFMDAGAEVFDYGNSIRAEAQLGGYEPRVRLPRLRPRLHPAAVLRGPRPVPLGRALGRPGRHRRDRPRGARAVPGERGARALDADGGREGPLPGPARADLLARPRRAPPRRPALQRDGRERRARRRRS